MKHTKKILLLALLVLIIPAASAVVDTTLQRYDPTPAQAGDLLTAYVNLYNNEDTTAPNVQLEILESSTIRPEGQSVINAGSIGSFGLYTATVQVRVARDAPAGQAVLRLRVREGNGDWQERTQTITIRSQEAAVLINNVDIQPNTLEPGKTATVSLRLENNANSFLRDITTQLDLGETPFVPLESSSRKKISELSPDEQATVTYTLAAQPAATSDIYRVPITISFTDEDGEVQEDQDYIGISVSSAPNTRAIVDSVSRTNGDVEVAVRIVNKGLSEVKFVEAELADEEGYTIPSSQRVNYVGNIDSDDWETLRFNIETDQQQVSVPLIYNYQDAFNNEIQEETTLTFGIPEETAQGVSFSTMLLILVIIAGGVWYWRKRKNKK